MKNLELQEEYDDPSFNISDFDSTSVKIQGRRRLCKVAVKDEEEEKEDEIFQDDELDFTAAVSDFDSPVPVKTTENKRESGNISHPTTSKFFKEKYESAILRGNDKNASDRDKRIGSAIAQFILPLKDLRNCIQPYFLRRLKNEVFRGDGGTNTAKVSKKNEIIVWLNV
ncbi:hypothetical protein LXL04_029033 [Taraxacum kok-saghyz]